MTSNLSEQCHSHSAALHASLIIRYSEDKKMYLYDIIDIKKETSNPIEP